ncbi:site-specific integrase [Aliarcobacter butzleri]|uniref:site-specific integrase n=1 Tax=Aliarcobacter butzleri TaxID=28197 RepID=UPI003B210FD1
MKLEEVINDFKFHCKFERNLSNKTMEAYSVDLNQFEKFKNYKSIDISEFDKYKLKEYVQSLYELELKVKTIKKKFQY